MNSIDEISESDASTSYPIVRTIFTTQTPSCSSVVVAESATYGTMLFLDGELQSASVDEAIYHESLVHPVMSACLDHSRILVIGGGEGATVREVLKWNPGHVDWVDIDQVLVNVCRLYMNWAPNVYTDGRVRYYPADIRDILPDLGVYNVILLDLPDPDGQTGYLYSRKFWTDLRSHLAEDGRIVTHTGPVRPFGTIGEGLQRIWKEALDSGFETWVDGFYSICIPSFQGEWGFWISGINPFQSLRALPSDLHVVDSEQMHQWRFPPLRWSRALAIQVKFGHGMGCFNTNLITGMSGEH